MTILASIFRFLLIGLFMTAALSLGPARAQSILRDAEMEAFLREIGTPIFEAAGLTPENVHLYLIADNSLNAFVTGGQNIFFHSGMILQADNVEQIIGVMGHETCHISCAHRISRGAAAEKAGNFSILSMVLGALAIAAGAGDAGMGLLLGGQTTAQFQFLAYSRGQESEADIAGARYLEMAGYSPRGLIEFFDKLRDQEVLALRRQDPYVRSHPLNRTRIQTLERMLERSPHRDKPINPDLNERFMRLQAKLYGYMQPTSATLARYPHRDTSVAAHYARAYAYHKALEWDRAIAEADALLAKEPNNPYFHEIKGQILFENHKLEESIAVFANAFQISGGQPLIATAYGQAIVSLEDQSRMDDAIRILKTATRNDPFNSFAWFNLARAYSYKGDEAMANLATAERFYAVGALPQAYGYAYRAQQSFSTGTPEWVRAQDILFASERAARDQADGRRRRRLTDAR